MSNETPLVTEKEKNQIDKFQGIVKTTLKYIFDPTTDYSLKPLTTDNIDVDKKFFTGKNVASNLKHTENFLKLKRYIGKESVGDNYLYKAGSNTINRKGELFNLFDLLNDESLRWLSEELLSEEEKTIISKFKEKKEEYDKFKTDYYVNFKKSFDKNKTSEIVNQENKLVELENYYIKLANILLSLDYDNLLNKRRLEKIKEELSKGIKLLDDDNVDFLSAVLEHLSEKQHENEKSILLNNDLPYDHHIDSISEVLRVFTESPTIEPINSYDIQYNFKPEPIAVFPEIFHALCFRFRYLSLLEIAEKLILDKPMDSIGNVLKFIVEDTPMPINDIIIQDTTVYDSPMDDLGIILQPLYESSFEIGSPQQLLQPINLPDDDPLILLGKVLQNTSEIPKEYDKNITISSSLHNDDPILSIGDIIQTLTETSAINENRFSLSEKLSEPALIDNVPEILNSILPGNEVKLMPDNAVDSIGKIIGQLNELPDKSVTAVVAFDSLNPEDDKLDNIGQILQNINETTTAPQLSHVTSPTITQIDDPIRNLGIVLNQISEINYNSTDNKLLLARDSISDEPVELLSKALEYFHETPKTITNLPSQETPILNEIVINNIPEILNALLPESETKLLPDEPISAIGNVLQQLFETTSISNSNFDFSVESLNDSIFDSAGDILRCFNEKLPEKIIETINLQDTINDSGIESIGKPLQYIQETPLNSEFNLKVGPESINDDAVSTLGTILQPFNETFTADLLNIEQNHSFNVASSQIDNIPEIINAILPEKQSILITDTPVNSISDILKQLFEHCDNTSTNLLLQDKELNDNSISDLLNIFVPLSEQLNEVESVSVTNQTHANINDDKMTNLGRTLQSLNESSPDLPGTTLIMDETSTQDFMLNSVGNILNNLRETVNIESQPSLPGYSAELTGDTINNIPEILNEILPETKTPQVFDEPLNVIANFLKNMNENLPHLTDSLLMKETLIQDSPIDNIGDILHFFNEIVSEPKITYESKTLTEDNHPDSFGNILQQLNEVIIDPANTVSIASLNNVNDYPVDSLSQILDKIYEPPMSQRGFSDVLPSPSIIEIDNVPEILNIILPETSVVSVSDEPIRAIGNVLQQLLEKTDIDHSSIFISGKTIQDTPIENLAEIIRPISEKLDEPENNQLNVKEIESINDANIYPLGKVLQNINEITDSGVPGILDINVLKQGSDYPVKELGDVLHKLTETVEPLITATKSSSNKPLDDYFYSLPDTFKNLVETEPFPGSENLKKDVIDDPITSLIKIIQKFSENSREIPILPQEDKPTVTEKDEDTDETIPDSIDVIKEQYNKNCIPKTVLINGNEETVYPFATIKGICYYYLKDGRIVNDDQLSKM